jgi:hypothetical protein
VDRVLFWVVFWLVLAAAAWFVARRRLREWLHPYPREMRGPQGIVIPFVVRPEEDYVGWWRSESYPKVEMQVHPILGPTGKRVEIDGMAYRIDIYSEGRLYSRNHSVRHDSMSHRIIGWHFVRSMTAPAYARRDL